MVNFALDQLIGCMAGRKVIGNQQERPLSVSKCSAQVGGKKNKNYILIKFSCEKS